MKRILALLLAVITLLGVVSCGKVSVEDVPRDLSSVITSGDLLPVTETKEEAVIANQIFSVADAYVRTGKNADLNFAEARKETGFLELKRDAASSNNGRDVLLRFDLRDANLEDVQSVWLYLNSKNVGKSVNGKDFHICAYKITNDWDPSTVTYNNAPEYSEGDLAGKGLGTGLHVVKIDVTDAVFGAYYAGENEISFRLSADNILVGQMSIYNGDSRDESLRPKLMCSKSEPEATYEKYLTADEEENAAIWAHAERLVDEWFARYEKIKKNGDHKYDPVDPDPAEYQTTVKAHGSDGVWIDFPTRLVSSLKGYTEKVYDVDRYGGVLAGGKQEATGRYYTKKIGDRWWLVDPLGNLCHIRGTSHLKYAYVDTSTLEIEATLRKFGSFEKWAIAATRWVVEDLGFNAAHGTSPQVHSVENNIPVTDNMGGIIGYAGTYKLMIDNDGGVPEFAGGIMPVFDPEFETYIDGRAKATAERNAGRSEIVGYFSDNEILVADDMLNAYLNADHTVSVNRYSYATAWTWYCRITGEKYPNAADVDRYSEQLGVDLWDLFKGVVYDRYFGVCATAMKRHDPASLYFGNRFLAVCKKWEWMLRFAGYWCDVVSINYYYEWEIPSTRNEPGLPSLEQLAKWTGKPFLVTEFYAKGNDALNGNGEPMDNKGGAGWVVKTQTERGYFYQNYTLKLLQFKNSIGWMQFQYIDNDPTDTLASAGAAQNSNKGLVDWRHDFEVYSDFTEQVELINKNAYALIEYFDGVEYFK